MRGLRLVRRERPLRVGQAGAVAAGVVAALALSAILLALTGHSPLSVYQTMFDSALGSSNGWSATLNRAVPIGLCGLAVAVAGSMGLWNIGAEGQIVAGAIAAAWIARLGDDWSGPLLITTMLVASVVGGGLWALGPAWARSQLGVNEIITTLMLNEIAIRAVRYLVNGPWKDPEGNNFPVAPELPEAASLPVLFGRTNIGLIIAAVVLAAVGWFAARSAWGYELRIAGSSQRTATYVGISLRRKIFTVLVLSGAIAGLAGGIELTGNASRLTEGISSGFGFTGIIVAALALMRPAGVAAVALVFGAVQIGGEAIQTQGVPSSTAGIIEALVLFCTLAAAVFTQYQLRTGRDVPATTAGAPA